MHPLPGLPAADASALVPGELGVPGDRRGPDRSGVTTGRGSAARRRRGAVCRARHCASPEASGQWLDTVPAPKVTACGREPHSSAARSPAGRPSAGAPRRGRRLPDAMTRVIPRNCGGDMFSPQKCTSTRHDSSTASDNRRYARPPDRQMIASAVSRTGRYGAGWPGRWARSWPRPRGDVPVGVRNSPSRGGPAGVTVIARQ